LTKKILTVTLNPTVDAASEAATVRPTRKIRTFDESFHPGGGGINVARVIHRLGGDVTALYARGGVMGAVLDHLLQAQGVPCNIIEIDGNTRINNVIHETATGMEYRFIAEGPILCEADWQKIVAAVERQEWHWLVVSGSLPRGVPVEIYDEFIKLTQARGGKIAIDTSGVGLNYVLARGGMTLVKPSQGEFEAWHGKHFASVAELALAARDLVAKGISEMVAVTLGHQGAVLANADTSLYLASPPVRVVSASGAGDSFIAGMVHALARGQGQEDAFRLGVACGSAAVMEKGTDLCQLAAIKSLFEHLAPSQSALLALPLNEE